MKELGTASHDSGPRYAFGELLDSNPGVLLRPLVATDPVDEMDLFTVTGIASTPHDTVNDIIDAYALPEEVGAMKERLREIRIRAKDMRQPSTSQPLPLLGESIESATNGSVGKVSEPKPAEEAPRQDYSKSIKDILFAGSKVPDMDKIGQVVALNPRDPNLPIDLGKVFKDHGHNFDYLSRDNPLQKRAKEVIQTTWKAYEEAVFGTDEYMKPKDAVEIIKQWTGATLQQGYTSLSISLQLGMIKTAMSRAIKGTTSSRTIEYILLETTEGLQHLADKVGLDHPDFMDLHKNLTAHMNGVLAELPANVRKRLKTAGVGLRNSRKTIANPPLTTANVMEGRSRGSVNCIIEF